MLQRYIALSVKILCLFSLILLLNGIFSSKCWAQCGSKHYNPPSEDSGAAPSPGKPAPGKPGNPARPGTSKPSWLPSGPITSPKGKGGSTGGLGKKAKGAATIRNVAWEIWWARNRYQFFEVRDIYKNSSSRYPLTGNYEGEESTDHRLFTGLRNGCLKAIKPYLKDNAPLLRRIALFALGRFKDHTAVNEMIECLQDNNHYVRDAAVLGLGINGGAKARQIIMHVAMGSKKACRVLDQDPVPAYVRAIATITLSLTKTPGIEPMLQSIALDKDAPNDVRAMALEGLGLMGGETAAEFLIRFIDDPKVVDPLVSQAITALCKTRQKIGLFTVKKCLQSKRIPLQQSAALGIWRLADEQDDAIVQLIHSNLKRAKDQAVKGFSLLSMGLVGGETALEHLKRIATKGLCSERPWACMGMGFALRKIKDEQAENCLMSIAKASGNMSTRNATAVALGLCKCKRALPYLIKLLQKGDDPNLRGYAAIALGLINDPSALEHLRKSLREDHHTVVLGQTVLALGLMHDLESAPELMDCMIETPNIVVKGMISRCLQFMGKMQVAEKILERFTTEKYDYRTTKECICLLSRLLSSQTTPYMDKMAADSNWVMEYPVVSHMLEYGL